MVTLGLVALVPIAAIAVAAVLHLRDIRALGASYTSLFSKLTVEAVESSMDSVLQGRELERELHAFQRLDGIWLRDYWVEDGDQRRRRASAAAGTSDDAASGPELSPEAYFFSEPEEEVAPPRGIRTGPDGWPVRRSTRRPPTWSSLEAKQALLDVVMEYSEGIDGAYFGFEHGGFMMVERPEPGVYNYQGTEPRDTDEPRRTREPSRCAPPLAPFVGPVAPSSA